MNRHDFLNRIKGRSGRQSGEQVSEWRSVASGASECQHTSRRAHWPGPRGTDQAQRDGPNDARPWLHSNSSAQGQGPTPPTISPKAILLRSKDRAERD